MKAALVFCIFLLAFPGMPKNPAANYVGDNLLSILGESTDSPDFKDFNEFWLLNRDHENIYRGIKIFDNPVTGNVDSILIAGDNFHLNGTRFLKFSPMLPFGILWDDDTARLRMKLGEGQKLQGMG